MRICAVLAQVRRLRAEALGLRSVGPCGRACVCRGTGLAMADAMLPLRIFSLCLPVLGLCAQDAGRVRLRDCLAAPMAYATVDAAAGRSADGRNALLDLVTSLAALGDAKGSAQEAMSLVGGLLARSAGEVELAVLGCLPSGTDADAKGTPLVVLRTELPPADAQRMERVFADAAVARPERVVHGTQTYVLVGSAEAAQPGQVLEVAMRGNELLVANHARGLEEALDTTTGTARRTLAADPRYQKLVGALAADPSAMLVYADVTRCGPRLPMLAGLSGSLLRWSGLGNAEAMAASVAPQRAEKRIKQPKDDREAQEDVLRSQVVVSMPESVSLDGWLGFVSSAPVRQMADELPAGGLGGFVFAVEPERVIAALAGAEDHDHPRGHDHGHDRGRGHGHEHDGDPASPRGFAPRLDRGCREGGIDLEKTLKRLGKHGAMQMVLLPTAQQELVSVFALQAQSKKAANDIAAEFSAALRRDGTAPGRVSAELDVRAFGGENSMHLGATDDWLVFAQRPEAIAALQAAQRDRARSRAHATSALQRAVRAFPEVQADRHGGVFHLDLRGVVGADGASNPAIPAVHAGVVDVDSQPGAGSSLVRLRVLSTR